MLLRTWRPSQWLRLPLPLSATPCRALPQRTVAEALPCLNANKWQAAIDEELGSCQTFGVWEEVHLPGETQALPSFFIFEMKRDGQYKARLVAGRHLQRQGLDFGETYASVGSYRTMHMMMALSAHEELELRQFDVRTAFLHGRLKEEVYLQVPAGMEGKPGEGPQAAESHLWAEAGVAGLKRAA
jgi:hypothetical protein